MSISFDIFDDQLSYAYGHLHSRGRHSHLVYLVEQGNNEQRRILTRVQTVDDELKGWIAGLVRGGPDAPPKSTYIGLDPYQSDSEDEDEEFDVMFDIR